MAARRLALKAVDWVDFAARVPPNQKRFFVELKTRTDGIAAKLASLPPSPAPIDWSFYRSAVAKAGMVEDFENKFKTLRVPEPVDTQTNVINEQEVESNKVMEAFIEESNVRLAEYEAELTKMNNLIPFELMTLDDLHEAFPGTKLDKVKYPFWPHKPIADL